MLIFYIVKTPHKEDNGYKQSKANQPTANRQYKNPKTYKLPQPKINTKNKSRLNNTWQKPDDLNAMSVWMYISVVWAYTVRHGAVQIYKLCSHRTAALLLSLRSNQICIIYGFSVTYYDSLSSQLLFPSEYALYSFSIDCTLH